MFFTTDLETSGLDVKKDEPVEIGFALVNPEGPYHITSMIVRSAVEVHPKALECHCIVSELVENGVRPAVVARMIAEILSDPEIEGVVGFNAFKFDIPMLKNFLERHGQDGSVFDRLPVEDPAMWYLAEDVFHCPRPKTKYEYGEMATKWVPKGQKYNLAHVCEQNEVVLENAHRAAGDLEATIMLWRQMR